MQAETTGAPLPEHWPRPKRPVSLVLSVGYFAFFAAAMIGGSVWAFTTGQTMPAVLLIIGAVGFGHLCGLAGSQLRQPRGPGHATMGTTDTGETGLAFSYAWGPYYWLLSVVGSVTLVLAGVAVLALLGGGTTGWVVAMLSAAGTGFLLWFIATVVRRAPGRVVLTPNGIFHRSITFEHFVPWFAVTAVAADQDDHPVIAVKAYPSDGSRYTGRLRSYESQYLPILVIRSYRLGSNTVPAFHALHHYFHNPDERAQLSDSPRTFTEEA